LEEDFKLGGVWEEDSWKEDFWKEVFNFELLKEELAGCGEEFEFKLLKEEFNFLVVCVEDWEGSGEFARSRNADGDE
jgi:hypothetical protein